MKTLIKLTLVLFAMAFVLVGCGTKDILGPDNTVFNTKAAEATPDTYPIIAGQNYNAGTMSLWNDDVNIYVKFDLTGTWTMEQSHVDIESSVFDIPGYPTPIPGQFDYITTHNPPVVTYTYTIPLANYTFGVGDTIVVAAHASVLNSDPNYGGGGQETAFGGDIPGPGPRWWYYAEYVITENTPPPPPPPTYQYETAMLRMYDVPNDFTYRWKMDAKRYHAWFSYVKTYPTLVPQTYYFYAGQTNKAGEAQIWKEGDYLKVQVDMMNGWMLSGSHLNVQLTGYVGSPSFGLFPYMAIHDPITNTYTYSVPWNNAWDGMELNIALHGDVQKEIIITP